MSVGFTEIVFFVGLLMGWGSRPPYPGKGVSKHGCFSIGSFYSRSILRAVESADSRPKVSPVSPKMKKVCSKPVREGTNRSMYFAAVGSVPDVFF
jgi:hypothetical protein